MKVTKRAVILVVAAAALAVPATAAGAAAGGAGAAATFVHWPAYLLSPAHLQQLVPDLVERDVFLCGPPAMTAALEQNVRRARVPRRHIHTERFALT